MLLFGQNLSRRFGLLALLVVMQHPTSVAAQESTAAMIEQDKRRAPVIVDGVTLFSVRGVSAYPAETRAEEIAGRIVAVASDPNVSKDSLKLSELPNATVVMAGNQLVVAVVDADGVLEGVKREVLALALQARIAEAIDRFRQDREPARLARHSFYAIAATLLLGITIFLGLRILRRIQNALARRYEHRIRAIRIQSLEIIRADQVSRVVKGLWQVLCGAAVLTAIYLYLDYVLSLFPWTRGVSNKLLHVIAEPVRVLGNQFLGMIPNLMFLVVLGLLTRYLLSVIRLFFDAIENGKIRLTEFDPAWAKPTYRLARIAVIACALIVAYPYIPGSNTDAFKGISLFIGVLFSLGSTSLINNIIAGYTLTYRRTFKEGDRVKIGDVVGIVQNIRIMATYLHTVKNELVVVPNSKIVSDEILNYSALASQQGLILHTAVGIGYEVPWRKVTAMLLEAAARTPGLLREPKPYVLQKALGDFAVTYEINGYCDQPAIMGGVYTKLHQNVLDLFNEYGVQIMTPAYEGDPKQAKIVPKDQWYAAPARPADSEDTTPLPKAS